MRFVLICLAAVLLSGCGYIAGKRVDFASDFSKYPDRDINALAGKTFYISNFEDYERLIQLKKDLRQLSNSPTPTRFLQEDCVRDILQITRKYDSGILGILYWGKVSKEDDSFFVVLCQFFLWPLMGVGVIGSILVSLINSIAEWIRGLFTHSK